MIIDFEREFENLILSTQIETINEPNCESREKLRSKIDEIRFI